MDRVSPLTNSVPAAVWVPQTKLCPPAVGPDVVVDDVVLADLVDRIGSHRVTFLMAQGGAGKTTLLALAVGRLDAVVAWVRLDEADNGPRSVVELLVLALDRVAPEACRTVRDLVLAGHEIEPRQLAGVLVNDVAGVECDLVVVLDDVHHLDDPVALGSLSYLFENLPNNLRIVVAGRRQPMLGLARLRANGEIWDVSADLLRFDLERAMVLLDGLGVDADQSRVSQLVEDTAGWVTALLLAVRSDNSGLRGSAPGVDTLDDYLAEEVVAAESAEVQHLLRSTAVLGMLDAEACQVVSGVDNAELILRDLRRRLPFLISDYGGRLCYHDLLRDHLLADLDQTPEVGQEAHRRAAKVTIGLERVDHLLAAGEDDLAAEAIEALGRRHYARPALANRLQGAAKLLDQSVRSSRPWLELISAAGMANTGHLDQAIPHLESARENAGDDFELRWLAVRFLHLATHDHARFAPLMAAMEADARFETLSPQARVEYLIASAWGSMWTGAPQVARRRVEQATDLVRSTGDVGSADTLAIHYGAPLSPWPDGLAMLESYHRWALDRFGAESVQVRVGSSLNLAAVEVLSGRAPGELGLSPAEIKFAETVPFLAVGLVWPTLVRARMTGDLGSVVTAYQHAVSLFRSGNPMAQIGLSALAPIVASVLREQRRPDDIERLASELRTSSMGRGSPGQDLASVLVEAELKWARGQLAAAEQQLAAAASSKIPIPQSIEPKVELAVLLGEQERWAEARDLIAEVFDDVVPSGALARIAQSGTGLVPVLEHLAGTDKVHAVAIMRLLAAPVRLDAQPIPGSRESLTSKEMEVLVALSRGGTNHDIATVLYVSENTVKTHMKRIFTKLDVGSRTEAVARARELRLV